MLFSTNHFWYKTHKSCDFRKILFYICFKKNCSFVHISFVLTSQQLIGILFKQISMINIYFYWIDAFTYLTIWLMNKLQSLEKWGLFVGPIWSRIVSCTVITP